MPRAVDPAVLDVLRSAEIDGGAVTIAGQLDRDLYVRVDKALKGIGAKWDRRARRHLFTEPEGEALLREMIDGGEERRIDAKGFFPTPLPLIEQMVDAAQVWSHHTVLEPSAGRGAIVDYLLNECFVAPENLWAVELQRKHADHLAVPNVIVGDFMEATPPIRFDRVLMNPPFERQQDIDHVARAFDMLAPGGRLVAIMSAGAPAGSRRKNDLLRDLIDRHGSVDENPEGSFKPSGTDVRTVTVTLTRSTASSPWSGGA